MIYTRIIGNNNIYIIKKERKEEEEEKVDTLLLPCAGWLSSLV